MLTKLLTISLMHWVVLVTPGVNFVLLLQLTASGRRSTALAAVVGITCATFIWALLAVLGVGVIFSSHSALRYFMQCLGGLYLCWIAYKMWGSTNAATAVQQLDLTHAQAFRRGFLTNILNPKPAVFFGSVFLTIFPQNPSFTLIVLTVAMVYFNAVIWHVFLALAFSHSRVQSVYDRFRTPLNRISATVIAAFGGKLLITTLAEIRR
jgi:threonine efflux protein